MLNAGLYGASFPRYGKQLRKDRHHPVALLRMDGVFQIEVLVIVGRIPQHTGHGWTHIFNPPLRIDQCEYVSAKIGGIAQNLLVAVKRRGLCIELSFQSGNSGLCSGKFGLR